VQGFFDGKTVHIVAGNLSPNDLNGVLLHEFWHKALHALGFDTQGADVKDIKNPVLRNLMARLEAIERLSNTSAGKNSGLGKWFQKALQNMPNMEGANRLTYLNELAAYAIQEYENAPRSLPQRVLKWVEDFFAELKTAIAQKFPDSKLGQRIFENMDAADFAAIARRMLREPSSASATNAEPMFALAPIMRRRDIVGAIMRNTGGVGIHYSLAETLTGEKAGKIGNLIGVFTKYGKEDLDDIATLLRVQEGYDVKDGHELEELIRRASFGHFAKSVWDEEEEAAAAKEKEYRAEIRARARKLGLRVVGIKSEDLEKAVFAAEEKEARAEKELVEAEARAEREAIQAEGQTDQEREAIQAAALPDVNSEADIDTINRLLADAVEEGRYINDQFISNEEIYDGIDRESETALGRNENLPEGAAKSKAGKKDADNSSGGEEDGSGGGGSSAGRERPVEKDGKKPLSGKGGGKVYLKPHQKDFDPLEGEHIPNDTEGADRYIAHPDYEEIKAAEKHILDTLGDSVILNFRGIIKRHGRKVSGLWTPRERRNSALILKGITQRSVI
jgi:hypothetical protein